MHLTLGLATLLSPAPSSFSRGIGKGICWGWSGGASAYEVLYRSPRCARLSLGFFFCTLSSDHINEALGLKKDHSLLRDSAGRRIVNNFSRNSCLLVQTGALSCVTVTHTHTHTKLVVTNEKSSSWPNRLNNEHSF